MKRAFKTGLIDDDSWLKMATLRNEIAHDYDLDLVEESMQVITGEYVSLFEKLVEKINGICEK